MWNSLRAGVLRKSSLGLIWDRRLASRMRLMPRYYRVSSQVQYLRPYCNYSNLVVEQVKPQDIRIMEVVNESSSSNSSNNVIVGSKDISSSNSSNMMQRRTTTITPLEKCIRDAKELLNLDTFPSLASLTLQSLFSNQADIIRAHMGKVLGSQHPILRLARDFYHENASLFEDSGSGFSVFETSQSHAVSQSSLSIQLRAILVLLISKSIGFPLSTVQDGQTQDEKIILNKQRGLAEITEMMYTAYTLHQTIMNIPPPSQFQKDTIIPHWFSDPVSYSRLHDGNNLAALMGDFLLAKSSGGLSSLKHHGVTELMTNTIADFSESQFITMGVPSEGPKISKEFWFRKNRLGMGSLLGHASYCCLVFSGHEKPIRNLGYQIGETVGLLLQASKEIEFFLEKTEDIPIQFELCSLPVIYFSEIKSTSKDQLVTMAQHNDYQQIFHEIQSSTEVLNKSIAVVEDLQKQTENLLNRLASPSPEAVKVLRNLLRCITAPVLHLSD